jgi:hypothetical protein
LALASAASLLACREEPTIVIKFEPNDLSGVKPADLAAHPAGESQPIDLGVAKKPAAGKASPKAECKAATDCVLEPIDCCDCANGGKQHAVTKKMAAATKSARAQKCKTAVCTMMLSTDPSCGQRADCVNGACAMVKK